MNYEEWNARLSQDLFNPAHAGRRVYLHVTAEKLNALGEGGIQDFLAAIRAGPAHLHGSFCEKALAAQRQWRDRRAGPPPFIAYLCFFALAAAHEGNWPAHAYYPRLWDLLGAPDAGMPPRFDAMKELWRELETWSAADHAGTLGIFRAQTAGRRANVGLPIAQTILTEEERRRLPELFDTADLEPGADIAPESLAAAIAGAAHLLRRRTQLLLTSRDDSEYRTALLEALQAELLAWNGTVPATAQRQDPPARAGLRLWLSSIDGGHIKPRLIAALPDGVESSELLLECTALPGRQFECGPGNGVWSGPLCDAADGGALAAELVAWEGRAEFRCALTGRRFVLSAPKPRVFASALDAAHRGGFIETRMVPSAGEFFLAAAGADAAFLADWGPGHCENWREVAVRAGFRAGWRLFRASACRDPGDAALRFPIFRPASGPAIRLEGGIRAGLRYFPFALPAIVVDSAETQEVRLNNIAIPRGPDGRFAIPAGAAGPVNSITALVNGEEAHEMLYVLCDGWTWRDGTGCPASNEYGERAVNGSRVRIRGASVEADQPPPFSADPRLAVDGASVVLGSVPGQVAELDGAGLPPWPPVWAVSFRRREVLFAFCGTSVADALPRPAPAGASLKKWRSVLWTERKRARPLRTSQLRALLRAYQEAARAL